MCSNATHAWPPCYRACLHERGSCCVHPTSPPDATCAACGDAATHATAAWWPFSFATASIALDRLSAVMPQAASGSTHKVWKTSSCSLHLTQIIVSRRNQKALLKQNKLRISIKHHSCVLGQPRLGARLLHLCPATANKSSRYCLATRASTCRHHSRMQQHNQPRSTCALRPAWKWQPHALQYPGYYILHPSTQANKAKLLGVCGRPVQVALDVYALDMSVTPRSA